MINTLGWWDDLDYKAFVKHGYKMSDVINTTLATIKLRGGRCQWIAKAVNNRTDWPVENTEQGHCKTLEEAKLTIERIWFRTNKKIINIEEYGYEGSTTLFTLLGPKDCNPKMLLEHFEGIVGFRIYYIQKNKEEDQLKWRKLCEEKGWISTLDKFDKPFRFNKTDMLTAFCNWLLNDNTGFEFAEPESVGYSHK